MKRWTMATAGAVAALTLAACGSTTSSMDTNGAASHVISAPVMNQLLQSYHWHLDEAVNASGTKVSTFHAPGMQDKLQLRFMAGSNAGEQFLVTRVCNTMRGDYTLQGEQIKVGRLASTAMACVGDGLAQMERAVGQQLQQLHTVNMVQGEPLPKIAVSFKDGSRWHMSGTPTDEKRYGSVGETIFLEVAPQTKPCNSGAATTQCLQVRELKYDSAGRKSVASVWSPLYEGIQGYTHQPGTRNVLRVKRYSVSNPPADGSSIAYVLDMRVETELVRP